MKCNITACNNNSCNSYKGYQSSPVRCAFKRIAFVHSGCSLRWNAKIRCHIKQCSLINQHTHTIITDAAFCSAHTAVPFYKIFKSRLQKSATVQISTKFLGHDSQQQQQQPFNGRLSGTTRVGRYQKKHSSAHTHSGQRTSFITFLHLQRSTASSLFSLCAWQSSRTTSFQVLFGLTLGLEPSTSYSMHFFTQSSSSFRSTCPYQRSLFCCNINAVIYT